MARFVKKVLALGAGLLAPLVAALGEDQEISMFDEATPGFLFSYGLKQYLGTMSDDSGHRLLVTVKDRNQGAKVYFRIVKDDKGMYGVILSGSEQDMHMCSFGHSNHKEASDTSFYGCPSGFIDATKEGGVAEIKRYDGSSMFRFVVSPPVLARHHAFRIYHSDKCLTVQKDSTVAADECEYEDLEKKARQLFIWVNNDLFTKKINPLYSVDPVQNPANPYYMPESTMGVGEGELGDALRDFISGGIKPLFA